MKKILVLCISFIALSCSDHLQESEVDNITSGDEVLFVVNEDVVTYTSLSGDNKILWSEGDKIGIFCFDLEPPAVNERAVLHYAYAGLNRGVFRSDLAWGSDEHTFYVYYPWLREQSPEPVKLMHRIEPIQYQSGVNNSTQIGNNTFMYTGANTAVSSGELSLDFTHTTCILELSFTSPYAAAFGKEITKIKFTSDNGSTLSGAFMINITSPGSQPYFTEPSDSVVLELENFILPSNLTESVKAYMVINPTNMTSVSITYTVDGQEYVYNKALNRTLAASKIYKLAVPVDISSISASPTMVYLSPVTPSATISISSPVNWEVDGDCRVATATPLSGTSEAGSVTLTRKTSMTNYTVYGNSQINFKTSESNPKYTSVGVANLHIDVPEIIYIPNPSGADTTLYIADIITLGGDSAFVVESYTGSWIELMEYDNTTRQLKAKVTHNSTNTDRPGTLTVSHINDPNYKVTISLLQNEFQYIPEFKYFVVDIQWCMLNGMDIDIGFMFDNNNPVTPFEDLPVGWGSLFTDPNLTKPSNWSSLYTGSYQSDDIGRTVLYNSDYYGGMYDLLNWGGDAVNGEGETVYFDAQAFNDATDVPRYINLSLYLNWYAHVSTESWYVRATLRCYKGGTMEKYSSRGSLGRKVNYRNIGGELVHSYSFFIELDHIVNASSLNFTTRYTYAAKIRYDRITHYGMMYETDSDNPKWTYDRPLCLNGADTYSSPLTPDELNKIIKAKQKITKELFK